MTTFHRLGGTAMALGFTLFAAACSDPDPDLIPWPRSVEVESGQLALSPGDLIVPLDPTLAPLASVVAEEVRLVAGIELDAGRVAGRGTANVADAGGEDAAEARAEAIVLQIDTSLAEEEHVLSVDSVARVSGGSYGAVAMGTVTLLQSLRSTDAGSALPRITVHDRPRSAYRGLLVDVARQWHSVETLKQIVVMCRLYKIRFLHLHLTDNQSFTFPSRAFPEVATPGRHYTWEELEELEDFASDRGVTLVPEIDIPGHSYALVSARPDIFGISRLEDNPYVVNMGREEAYAALDQIIGELATVFESSPFIHIGGDETWLAFLDEDPDAAAFMHRNEIRDAEELYRYFLVRMNESVRRHGKQTIVWEGFREEGEIEIPRNILVMAWETAYQLPQDLLEGGYTIINVSWKPLYVVRNRRWSPEYIYGWEMYRWENWYRPTPSFSTIQLEPNENVIGAQMAAWEQTDVMEIPSLRRRLPALSERIWNPDLGRGFADFARRFTRTDSLLQRLIRPALGQLSGQTFPGYSGPFFNRENWFGDTLALEVHPLRDEYRVFVSTHTGRPGAAPLPSEDLQWMPYGGPVRLSETTSVWLRVEDERGKTVGFPWRTDYEFRPLSLAVEGLADIPLVDPAAEPSVFHDGLMVTLSSSRSGGTIRYTLTGDPPTPDSPPYQGPVELTETATLSAQLMDGEGRPVGEPIVQTFKKVELTENLTTGMTVTTSQGPGPNPAADLAMDGMVDRDAYWGVDAGGDPPWIQVDLGETKRLSAADLVTYWDGRRYYRYAIEVSLDGDSWTQVVDGSENTTPATESGYHHEFTEVEGRFVRVTMLENSANSWVHVVEVRVY